MLDLACPAIIIPLSCGMLAVFNEAITMSSDGFNADLRSEYHSIGLDEHTMNADPHQEFASWWEQAVSHHVPEMNAAVLATVTADFQPKARMILIKDFSAAGYVFFTNYNSAKGHELLTHPVASLLIWWQKIARQIRLEGTVEKISAEESDLYFHSRPKDYQIGAWVSAQSEIIPDRNVLIENYRILQKKYAHETVPRPPHWGGYILKPHYFEFWSGGEHRLHDRILYQWQQNQWQRHRLAP
jgi:pyridoxamine 5'-phosphate oxidase